MRGRRAERRGDGARTPAPAARGRVAGLARMQRVGPQIVIIVIIIIIIISSSSSMFIIVIIVIVVIVIIVMIVIVIFN